MKNIMSKITALALSAAIFSPALIQTAQAQQDPNRDERRETRRQQMQNMTPEQRAAFRAQRRAQRGQNGGRNGGNWGDNGGGAGGGGGAMMNPQGQEAILNAAGIVDKATMDAILAFAAERQKAREPLVKQAQDLSATLLAQNGTDDAFSSQLTQLRIGVEVYKREHAEALKAVDTKIEYSKRPQLEALLTLMGLLGDEVPTIGGPMVAMGPSARQILRANRPQDGEATAETAATATAGTATTSTTVTTTTATPAGTTSTSSTTANTATPKTTPKAAAPKTTP